MINNIETLIKFLRLNVLLDKNEKEFVKFNKSKWKKILEKEKKNKSIILVDLFPWYPLIYFWSYIVNILSKEYNSEIKYFFFHLSKTRTSKFSFSITKLVNIYKSFNVKKGITDYDFVYSKITVEKFHKIKTKNDLINYKNNKQNWYQFMTHI